MALRLDSYLPQSPDSRATIGDAALDQIFREARTYSAWLPKRVDQELLKELYDTAKLGPTSANSSPLRVVFITSEEAKARLMPAIAPLNLEKVAAAPVVAILAYDTKFYDRLDKLFPHKDIRGWFADDPEAAEKSALVNGSLQAAYFIVAARALGLDAGPIGGFDADAVNKEFFPDGVWKVNFICNLGYGDEAKLFPRLPRLDFEEACQVL
jgi:3-hydroxypropanoate dehydrogenase